MARATVTDVKVRFNGNKTNKPNSFCIFFGAKNKNYIPFKLKESCVGRYYLIATCDRGLDEKFKTKSMEFDISRITLYGTEDDIHFQVVAVEEASQSQLTPGPYGKIEDISTYSSYFCVTIGGRKCFLDPCTEIRINGLPLDLETGNTTESAMKKLSKIFNNDVLKEISCIGYTAIPVLNGAAEWIKEINLNVPENLCIGAFGIFRLCASYPENYYVLKEEPSARIHLNTGKLYFRNEETMEFTPFGGLVDMTPSGADFDGDTVTRKKLEENTMIHKRKSLGIKNIIFNGPATIIFWDDNTKTIVKCGEGDVFDPEKGIAMAVMKRALGTNETDSNYLDKVRKYLDQYREKEQLDITPQDILTCVSNAIDTANEVLTGKVKDIRIRRLKQEAMDVRTKMMTSGATNWELETFDRFCRKYIAEESGSENNKNAKKE